MRKFNYRVTYSRRVAITGRLEIVSVLIIRAHKRFAVCRKVRLSNAGRPGIQGLLIELSLEGCRISNLGSAVTYALDEPVVIRIAGAKPISARVRWTRDGTVGARFSHPLHIVALQDLIKLCRGGPAIRQVVGE